MKYIFIIFLLLCVNCYSSSLSSVASGQCVTGADTPNSGGGECTDTSPSGQQTYTITFKACPKSKTPSLFIFPNDMTYPTSPDGGIGWTLASTLAEQVGSCTTTPSAGLESCDAQVIVETCVSSDYEVIVNTKSVGDYHTGASYVVTCY